MANHKAIDAMNDYMINKWDFLQNRPDLKDTMSQINEYRKASEITQDEIDRVKSEKDVEKRRINEKQIRSLRGSYRRPGGFLGNGGGSTGNTLGNSGELTNKLGG